MSIKLMSCVFESQDLSPMEKLVMLAICDHANQDNYCWPSMDRLTQYTSLTRTSISRIIKKLEESGFLKKKRRFGKSTIYTIVTGRVCYTELQSVSTQSYNQFPHSVTTEPSMNHKKESSCENEDDSCFYERAIECWNSVANSIGLLKIKGLSYKRKKSLSARIKDAGGIDCWCNQIKKIPSIRWMYDGSSRGGWKATFDFFLQETSFMKLIEGVYGGFVEEKKNDVVIDSRIESCLSKFGVKQFDIKNWFKESSFDGEKLIVNSQFLKEQIEQRFLCYLQTSFKNISVEVSSV